MESCAGAMTRLIYPPVCAGCSVMTFDHGALCAKCWSTVTFIEHPVCEVTGRPFDHDRGDGLVSPEAIADPPPYRRARAAVLHEGAARKLVHGLKYSDRADLAKLMAAWMVRAGRDVLDDSDAVIAVPLHRGRILMRRYNQSAELARHVAHLCRKPHLAGVLQRTRATRPQVGLGLRARQDNVRSAFEVRPRHMHGVAGRRILLIDDVLTTGSTVNAATKALLKAGAAQVSVLTFARVATGGVETLYA
nr:ComF family protein [Hoeflea marina]